MQPSVQTLAAPSATSGIRILGLTHEGRPFRPHNWPQRLAGTLVHLRGTECPTPERHLGYTRFCVPSTHAGTPCVVVDPTLRSVEPMAFEFLLRFAHDNNLRVESVDTGAQQRSGPNLAAA